MSEQSEITNNSGEERYEKEIWKTNTVLHSVFKFQTLGQPGRVKGEIMQVGFQFLVTSTRKAV